MQPQSLYQSLFPTERNGLSKKEMLEKWSVQYPYFSAIHFFLLNETPVSDDNYQKNAQKAALYFKTPYQLLNQLSKAQENPLEKFSATSNNNKGAKSDNLLFEPLYSSDYFASQGIKLNDEVKTNDKLGKQLKSFTEWLKTTKKTQNTPNSEAESEIDLSVEKMAENSNIEVEILTESLAEVYIQQGKKQKAIDIYKKLSLQFPSKNAYFAEKIKSI
jgi:hypothetical protein